MPPSITTQKRVIFTMIKFTMFNVYKPVSSATRAEIAALINEYERKAIQARFERATASFEAQHTSLPVDTFMRLNGA